MNKRINVLERRLDALEKKLGTPEMARSWFKAFLGEQKVSLPMAGQLQGDLDEQCQTPRHWLEIDHIPDRKTGEQDRGLDD